MRKINYFKQIIKNCVFELKKKIKTKKTFNKRIKRKKKREREKKNYIYIYIYKMTFTIIIQKIILILLEN